MADGGGSGGGEDEEDPPPPTGDGEEVRSGMGRKREIHGRAGKGESGGDGSRPKIAPYTTAHRATRLQYRMPNCCEFRIVTASQPFRRPRGQLARSGRRRICSHNLKK